jgi:phenylpropionate dioxygenase-like ring-hydroxylating dioxygenase large terminal subunit
MTATMGHRGTEPVETIIEGIRSAGTAPKSRATTLPPAAYTSQEVYDLEVDRLFRPGWMMVGRADRIPNPGDYQCVDLLGESLVMTRDRDGELHVISRVCAHRWMPVAEGSGNAKALQCPYHLWTYALSGELVGAPEMQQIDDFDKALCSLPTVRHEEWLGYVFVNLDGAAEPLAPQLEPAMPALTHVGAQDHQWFETVDWGECPWDWKVMVENYMECYHHIGSHRKTLQADFPGEATWTAETPDAYSLMHIPAAQDGAFAGTEDALLLNIFPISLISPMVGGAFIVRIFPLGPGRVHIFTDHLLDRSALASPDAEAAKKEMLDWITAVHIEDIEICSGVQRSLAGRLAPIGRLSHLEEPLWRLYRFLADRM